MLFIMFKSSNYYFSRVITGYIGKKFFNTSAINLNNSSKNAKLSFNEVPLEIKELIIGRVLGDSGLEITRGSINARMNNNHSIKQKEYIFHIYEQLKEFTKSPPKLCSYVSNSKTYETYKFNTVNCVFFTELYSMFYVNKKKIIPLNIEEYLTARSLAYWAMDDGYKSNNNFVFCTDSYTKEEVELLISVLKAKFYLDCTLYSKDKVKGTYRIYIRARSMDLFKSLVRPYFHDSMLYKLY